MPSRSKKQAKLMRAVAHGWKPSRIKGPTRTVAKEFVSADKRRDEVNGYNHGGYNRGGEMDYDGYQFGGGVPYRGVPPQRGQIQRGPTGMMGGRGRGMGGTYQDYFNRGGGFIPEFQGGSRGPGGPGGGAPNQGGPLRAMMQRMQGQRGGAPGGGQRMYGRPPTPGIHDLQDMSMGEGPGGRLEQESIRRQAKMRGPGRFPGAGGPDPHQGRTGPGGMGGRMSRAQNRFGALTQGAPGGGSFGKPRPSIPGRRTAPPPGRYPGGGNPNLRGRNPLMRAARDRTGRRGMLR